MGGSKQLKVGLRVRDLEVSCALYLQIGFRQIPNTRFPVPQNTRYKNLRYLTYGHT